MQPREFIYKSVLEGCLKAGLPDQASRDQAECAAVLFDRQQYSGKPLDLIQSQITKAKAINKKQRKARK